MHHTPPPCPSWCEVHNIDSEWDTLTPSATSKTCARLIGVVVRLDGEPFEACLERFAYLDGQNVHVDVPRLVLGQNVELDQTGIGRLRDVLAGATAFEWSERLTA